MDSRSNRLWHYRPRPLAPVYSHRGRPYPLSMGRTAKRAAPRKTLSCRSSYLLANATMNRINTLVIAAALGALPCAPLAQQVSKEQIKGLDEQVQDIKKDVLSISSELQLLEEKLLYPSNTQVS